MSESTRTLILLRHAKSSWQDDTLTDHERPLNARGIRDAPRMARRLGERGPRPEVIVSSSAVRALATAEAFRSELGMERERLSVEPAIYGAGVRDILGLIHGLDDAHERVMFVGHNPTFSRLASWLAGEDLGDLPTCAVVTLGWNGAWSEVEEGALELLDLDYPKKDSS